MVDHDDAGGMFSFSSASSSDDVLLSLDTISSSLLESSSEWRLYVAALRISVDANAR